MKIFALPLLALTVAAALAQENKPEDALRTMVENEGKFFQMSQDKGTRAAFLNFLADDAVVFQPGPTNGHQLWKRRPEKGIWITWHPLYAFMAHSADLGYTTGPAEWRKNKEDAKPFGYGQFLSIWKRQKDGAWKVALDVGGEVPGPIKAEEAPVLEGAVSNAPVPEKPPEPTASARLLRNAEGQFMKAAKTDSTAALLAASSTAVRVHREGVFPATDKDAAALMQSATHGSLTMERAGGGMSEAGDLGYSYGSYSFVAPEKTERGHYLQIWRAESDGAWKLAVDYQAPLPPEKKK